jgi:hypothetical protein
MRTTRRRILRAAALACAFATPGTARAGETGHFNPGVANIRDFYIPDPGFYGVLYDYWYTTDRLNDRHGHKVSSVTVGPGPGVTLGVDVNVDVYAIAPTLIWVSDWKLLGAKYSAYISPSFANSSISASLATASGSGRDADTSQFDVGDLFVQPLWLGWGLTHWDFALGYGFYAPVGRYDTETLNLPVVGPVKVESADNIGLGYWTHQIQGAAAWYPWDDKRMAVSGVLNYEINQDKEGFDFTAGQRLTLNWGISQYLPLKSDKTLLLELGPAGYDSWQVTDDTGSAARHPRSHDEADAVGGQLGVSYVPWLLSLNFHGFYEFYAEDRFQGASAGVNLSKKF